jgi:hypothetical protein
VKSSQHMTSRCCRFAKPSLVAVIQAGPFLHGTREEGGAIYRDRCDIRYERAQLPSALDRRIRTLSKDALRILGPSGYARIDMRLDLAGDSVFLKQMPTRISRQDILRSWHRGWI